MVNNLTTLASAAAVSLGSVGRAYRLSGRAVTEEQQ